MANETTNPTWEGKMEFLPGMPEDVSTIPVLHYQAIGGRVFTLLRFVDDSVSRGEVPLEQLELLTGKGVKEGWYDSTGAYVGSQLPGSLA